MLSFDEYIQQLFKQAATKITNIVDIGSTDIVDVDSTCLSEVRYDLITKRLEVTFRESGASYVYYAVDEGDYEALVNALSVGGEYNAIIKGSHLYSRIG